MKPFKTFPVLQRLTVDDFDLIVEPASLIPDNRDEDQYCLGLDGQVIFRLPRGLVRETVDFTKEEVAAMLFDWMFTQRANAISIGHEYGKETLRAELRSLLNVPSVPKGG